MGSNSSSECARSIADFEVGEILVGLGGWSELAGRAIRRVPVRVRAFGVRCAGGIRRLRQVAGDLLGAVPQRLLVIRVEVLQTRACTFAIEAALAW